MTQTLTTDELRQIVETDHVQCGDAAAMARELLDNREAQPVAGELGEIRIGRLPTMNQEEYPGLGDWWVQLRIGASRDDILARVYGATPDEAVARARALTAQPAPAVQSVVDWRLDESTGAKILMYKDCSVIEDQQAEYVLSLIQAAAPEGGN